MCFSFVQVSENEILERMSGVIFVLRRKKISKIK